MRLLALKLIRKVLRTLDRTIEGERGYVAPRPASSNGRERELRDLLSAIVIADPEALRYFDMHRERVVRTLSLVPPARRQASALEIGSYGYMSAALHDVLGYVSVSGCYYSPQSGRRQRTLKIDKHGDFMCDIDLFDAERDPFPYAAGAFEVVLCCEVIEHLVRDPLHMLFECHRVLAEEGLLIVTTPNIASLSSVAAALHGTKNPQIFSRYPGPGNPDTPHVREYTPRELSDALCAAGFAVEALFTEPLDSFGNVSWVSDLLAEHHFDTAMRGEQIYCLARKTPASETQRYPAFLYA